MVTTYFLNLVAGNVFGSKINPSIPGDYYLGLSSAAPSLDGTGAVEPVASAGYARVKLTGLSEPVNGVISNINALSLPKSTADWGTMTHFVVYDGATGGNLLMYDPLPRSRSVEADTIVTVTAESLKLTIQNPV